MCLNFIGIILEKNKHGLMSSKVGKTGKYFGSERGKVTIWEEMTQWDPAYEATYTHQWHLTLLPRV